MKIAFFQVLRERRGNDKSGQLRWTIKVDKSGQIKVDTGQLTVKVNKIYTEEPERFKEAVAWGRGREEYK